MKPFFPNPGAVSSNLAGGIYTCRKRKALMTLSSYWATEFVSI